MSLVADYPGMGVQGGQMTVTDAGSGRGKPRPYDIFLFIVKNFIIKNFLFFIENTVHIPLAMSGIFKHSD